MRSGAGGGWRDEKNPCRVAVRYRVEWNLLGVPLSDSAERSNVENANYVEAHL